MPRLPLPWIVASLALAACQPGLLPRPVATKAVASTAVADLSPLAGVLRGPAALISNNGGGVISNNGGGVVANNGASRRLLAIGWVPLPGFVVTAKDPTGRTLGQPATTDAAGRFTLGRLPRGQAVVVDATTAGAHLSALVRVGAEATLDPATTLVAEHLRATQADLGALDQGPVQDLVAHVRTQLEAGEAADLRDPASAAAAFDRLEAKDPPLGQLDGQARQPVASPPPGSSAPPSPPQPSAPGGSPSADPSPAAVASASPGPSPSPTTGPTATPTPAGPSAFTAFAVEAGATTQRARHASVLVPPYVYNIAGQGPRNQVERATLNADHSITTFSAYAGAQLVTARAWESAVVAGSRVYVLGGNDGTNSLASVESAPILPNGELGAFTDLAPVALATARDRAAVAVIKGYLYVFGGAANGTYLKSVERAAINPDGSLGAFASVPNLQLMTARCTARAVVVGDKAYVIGGANSAFLASTELSTIGADGTLAPFSTYPGAALANARSGLAVAVAPDAVYAIGGKTTGGTLLASVERSAIGANNTLGAFAVVPGAAMTNKRFDFSAVQDGRWFYVLGGSSEPSIERASF